MSWVPVSSDHAAAFHNCKILVPLCILWRSMKSVGLFIKVTLCNVCWTAATVADINVVTRNAQTLRNLAQVGKSHEPPWATDDFLSICFWYRCSSLVPIPELWYWPIPSIKYFLTASSQPLLSVLLSSLVVTQLADIQLEDLLLHSP